MMKKIFLFLLLIISFVSYGQTYNPANFTVTNKSIGQAQANPTDARSQFNDATNFVMRDYQSTTEVNSYLNLAKYRTGHFLVYIHNGGSLSAGVWTGGTTDIYIYKDGVLDANLVPLFTNTTLSNTGSGFRIVKPISGSDYPLRSLASSNTIIWDSTSNSNSLTGKVDTSLIVTINRLSDTAASIRLAISAGGGGITTLTGDVTASGTGSVAATIANNAVSNAKFRQSAALSVVGRTSNSTGNVADIAAATSGHVLRRNGTTLDFGTIDSVSVPLLHSENYYNTKYPTIGSDSVYVKAATNTGTSIFFIQGDTLKLKRLQAGTNVTLTSNADSSITIAASGGGGSQTLANVLATGRTLSTVDSVILSNVSLKFRGNGTNDNNELLSFNDSKTPTVGSSKTTNYLRFPAPSGQGADWYEGVSSNIFNLGDTVNEVMYKGWNITPGGAQKTAGWPGIADGYERSWKPISGGDLLTERHFTWIKPNGTIKRVQSFTLNNTLNDADLFFTVERMYLKSNANADSIYFNTAGDGGGSATQLQLLNRAGTFEIAQNPDKSVIFTSNYSATNRSIAMTNWDLVSLPSFFSQATYNSFSQPVYPAANVTQLLGSSSLRWYIVYGGEGNFNTGYYTTLPRSSSTIDSALTVDPTTGQISKRPIAGAVTQDLNSVLNAGGTFSADRSSALNNFNWDINGGTTRFNRAVLQDYSSFGAPVYGGWGGFGGNYYYNASNQVVRRYADYSFAIDGQSGDMRFLQAGSAAANSMITWSEKMRLSNAGELFTGGTFTDNGAYAIQNTGGLYQQGSFRLGGTRVATSNDVKLLVKGESDSTVAQLDFPIVQTSYSPTKTDVTNIGTASVTTSYYQRTGNKIEVWGEVTIDPTATGDTQITLSLPIASSMSNSYDLSGSAAAYDVNQSARIYYSGGVAVVRLNAADASSHVYSYRYVYYYFAP